MLLERLAEIKKELDQFSDGFTKYSFLVELSALNNQNTPDVMQECNLFKGCQSQVWIKLSVQDGLFYMHATSDTLLLRGLLYIMMQLYNGCPLSEIAETDLNILPYCGIEQFFTDQRISGVHGITKAIQDFCSDGWKSQV